MAGIGDERHAGVADESDFRALLEGEDEFGGASQFIVFVIADEWFANVVVGEEFLSVAGIFAGDLIHFLEDAKRAKGDVLEIADGGSNKIKTTGGRSGLRRWILCRHEKESSLVWGMEKVRTILLSTGAAVPRPHKLRRRQAAFPGAFGLRAILWRLNSLLEER
jgi:hypothetical protein